MVKFQKFCAYTAIAGLGFLSGNADDYSKKIDVDITPTLFAYNCRPGLLNEKNPAFYVNATIHDRLILGKMLLDASKWETKKERILACVFGADRVYNDLAPKIPKVACKSQYNEKSLNDAAFEVQEFIGITQELTDKYLEISKLFYDNNKTKHFVNALKDAVHYASIPSSCYNPGAKRRQTLRKEFLGMMKKYLDR